MRKKLVNAVREKFLKEYPEYKVYTHSVLSDSNLTLILEEAEQTICLKNYTKKTRNR